MQCQFRSELQIHSKLQHPNVVDFVRAFTSEQETFIVLGLCRNGSLKDMLFARKSLSLPEVRRFGLQLLGALHYVHSRSVIHRDVKAANIMLENMDIKLADFGLAAVLVTDKQMDVIRRTTLCGTPNYIAPEVLSRSKGHDTKADMWSFGVLMYIMLTGNAPFHRAGEKGPQALFGRVAHNEWQWPPEAPVSTEAKDLVSKLMQLEAFVRPSSQAAATHRFFSNGSIPAQMGPELLKKPPSWLDGSNPPDMKADAAKVSFASVITHCQLEIANRPSIYQEFVREEALKLAPTIPLVSVYQPFRPISEAIRASKRMVSPLYMLNPVESSVLRRSSPDIQQLAYNLIALLAGEWIWPVDISFAPNLPLIVAYCDYSDKFSMIGYLLATGAIGCFSERRLPTKAIVVLSAVEHYRRQVPQEEKLPKDATVHFYERSNEGLRHASASPADALDEQKQSIIRAWGKFADHVTRRHGEDPRLYGGSEPAASHKPDLALMLYQKLGNVAAYMWISGDLQFDFNDGTNLMLSADGTWTRLHYSDGASPAEISMPTSLLLRPVSACNRAILEAAEKYELREKLVFVKQVVASWIGSGEIGGIWRGEKLRWAGTTTADDKLTWITMKIL